MVMMFMRKAMLAIAAAFEVFAEAQQMARDAHRRYPIMED